MTDFLNFTKIVPPNPNDPDVNLAAQINANWDMMDSQITPYIVGGILNNLEAGQEFLDVNFRFAVWDGSTTRIPDTIDDSWSAWTNMPLASGRAARPSGPILKWRNNSALRMVELTGGLHYDSAQDPWAAGLQLINADSSGAIPSSMQPVGGYHISQCASGLSSGTTVVASGYIYIDKPAGNTFTRIRGQYLGGPGGGNFLDLSQVWWWY